MTFPPLRTREQRDNSLAVAAALCQSASEALRALDSDPLGKSVLLAGFARAIRAIDERMAPGFKEKLKELI